MIYWNAVYTVPAVGHNMLDKQSWNCARYYKYEILTRTADGDEGGRHQLISAAVGNGNLYILKVQIGEKRWFKGANAGAKGAL
jgi:hypothetical protein